MYTGQKTRLRAYKKEDAVLAYEFINDPEVKKFLVDGVPFPIPLWEEEKWVESNIPSSETYSFAVETLEEGKYIGGCGINKIDWKNRFVEIGILIGDKNYWGKGYGSDALKVLINFVFNEMNMNKVRLKVFSFNERAKKCYEKCGFKVEGVMRQEIFKEGKYHDEIVMGLLRGEWAKAQA